MFASPRRSPVELAIDVDDGGDWRRLYLSRSPHDTYRKHQFDKNRMRKLVSRAAIDGELFEDLSQWIARATFEDHPSARRVRVTLLRFDSLPHERVRAGERAERRVERQRVLSRRDVAASRENEAP
jgi:hypothetical protein